MMLSLHLKKHSRNEKLATLQPKNNSNNKNIDVDALSNIVVLNNELHNTDIIVSVTNDTIFHDK